MTEVIANEGYNAAPYMIVVVLCIFWLFISALQRRSTHAEKKPGGPHSSWRVTEVEAPLRRFWHVTRQKDR